MNLFEILKRRKWHEWNTAQNEPIIILKLGLLESKLHQYHYSLSEKSIHTLENKVLMHQCAIAQRISTYTLNFEI